MTSAKVNTDKPDQEVKEIKIEALVPLDGDTIGLRNLAHAEASDKRDKAKAAERARAKLARGEIAKLEELCAKLKETVLTGSEKGMVDGFERWDYDRFEVDTVRSDTGEVTNTRPMTEEERRKWKEPALAIDLGEAPSGGASTESGQKLVLRGKGKAKAGAAPETH